MSDEREYARFGPYLIIRVSGAGGMGRVELALRTDAKTDDVCVIKRLLREGMGPPGEQEARFRREAQIAARLEHRNIACTLRVEEIDGELCIAQEFIQGMDLARLMKRLQSQAVATPLAVHVVREVASALGYAHDFGGHGIVHRDVTPENVMVSFDGDVTLIDFGIARSAVDGTLTNAGMIIGRREYIAPELWEGAKPDRRADIYSLGVVLWELLTARRLEETRHAGPGKVLPDPCSVNPSLPSALGEVVARALAADPGERFQSAGDLQQALAPFAAAETDPKDQIVSTLRFYFNVDMYREVIAADIADARRFLESESPPRSRSFPDRRALTIGALAVAAAVGGGALFLRHPPPAAAPQTTLATEAAPKAWAQPPAAPEHPPAAAARVNTAVTMVPDAASGREAQLSSAAPRKARSAAPRAVTSAPVAKHPDELLREARDSWNDGDTPAATALARKAIAAGAGAPGHILLGTILLNSDKRSAEREFGEAVRLDPASAQAKNLLTLARQKIAEGSP